MATITQNIYTVTPIANAVVTKVVVLGNQIGVVGYDGNNQSTEYLWLYSSTGQLNQTIDLRALATSIQPLGANFEAQVFALSNGNILLEYNGLGNSVSGNAYFRVLSSTGTPLTGETIINGSSTSEQSNNSVSFTELQNGGLAFSWLVSTGLNTSSQHYTRTFTQTEGGYTGGSNITSFTGASIAPGPLATMSMATNPDGMYDISVLTVAGPGTNGDRLLHYSAAGALLGSLSANPLAGGDHSSVARLSDGQLLWAYDYSNATSSQDRLVNPSTFAAFGGTGVLSAPDDYYQNVYALNASTATGFVTTALGSGSTNTIFSYYDNVRSLRATAMISNGNATNFLATGLPGSSIGAVDAWQAGGPGAITIDVLTINNIAPTIGTSSGSTGYNAGDPAVVVDSGVVLADADSNFFDYATVSITSGFVAGQDVLAFTNTNSSTYGNITASYDATTGVLTLTSPANLSTVAQFQAALRAVTYADGSSTPSGTRTFSFVANDASLSSNTATHTATVAGVATNAAPVVTTSNGTTAFTEGYAAVVDRGVTVTDSDSGTLASATVSITAGYVGSEDVLQFTNTDTTTYGNITGSYASGVLTLTSANATATVAQFQAALRSVTYSDTSDTPNTATRTISFVANDGTANSAAATHNVSVTAVNDAPTVGIFAAVGGEMRINTTTAGDQYAASIAMLTGGGYVVTFVGNSNGAGTDTDAFFQRYDASGLPQGGETRINTTTAGNQLVPIAAALTGGGFVVTWQGPNGSDTNDTFAQRYDANGVAQGSETRINTTTIGPQVNPAVAALAGGGYVITWNGQGTGDAGGIFCQRFDASGNALGSETLVNTTTANVQQFPYITALAGGGYVIAWFGNGPGDTAGVFMQRYDASGVAQGTETRVNTTTTGIQDIYTVTGLAGGGYVVAWESSNQDAAGTYGIYTQRYDANGVALGGETLVNTTTAGDQRFPVAAALAGGGYIVTWSSFNQDAANTYGVYSQRYDANGVALGGETRVNTTTAGDQFYSFVGPLSGGGDVVVWTSNGQDGSGVGVYSQRYEIGSGGTLFATEQVPLNLKGSVTVGDVDGGSAIETATLSVTYGVLNVNAGTSGATVMSGNGTASVVVTGTIAQLNALLNSDATSAVSYNANTDTPPASATLTVSVNDGGATGSGGSMTGSATATINVTAVDDSPIAVVDSGSTNENAVLTVPAAGVLSNDTDVDGGPKMVASVNGSAANVGVQITLASGALLTLNADGSYSYNPNHKFDYLVSSATASVTGASDSQATDTFTYALNGGSSTTVTITITGVDGAGDQLRGDSGNNSITGTPQSDFFNLSQGGNDTASGMGGDDAFYMGAALSTGDNIDGGTGNDQLAVQGNYAGYTLGANNLTNIETLAVLSGSDTRFGDTAGNTYTYNLTTVDANVAAGQTLTVNSNGLLAGENLTFNGAAETDGKFLFYAGLGTDSLTGGQQSDGFYFGEGGRFTAADHVDGQGGADDQLALRGNYTVTFNAGTMVNIETLVFLSSSGAASGGPYSYDITLNDANVGAGKQLTVTGNTLLATESMRVDGSAETNGSFKFIGGAGNDTFIGGAGNDLFYGRGGHDVMTGGGGNDTFYFYATSESTNASPDQITDFTTGDKIDLSTIDANPGLAGDQAFTFLGQNVAFTHHAGEMHVVGSGTSWTVEVDTDGDGNADMSIQVTTPGGHTWVAGDFAL